MEPVLIAVAVVGVGWLVKKIADVVEAREQRWTDVAAATARRFDLAFKDRSSLARASVEGERAGIFLRVTAETNQHRRPHNRTRIVARAGLPDDVVIEVAGIGTPIGHFFVGGDLRVGDAAFNRRVVLAGNEALLRSLLDAETRARLLHALELGAYVRDGALTLVLPGIERDAEVLAARVQTVLELAEALRPARVAGALEALTLDGGPLAVAAFHARVRIGPAPAFVEAVRVQGRPALRVEALTHLGDAAGLAAMAADERAPPGVRLEALTRVDALDAERVVTTAQAALAHRPDEALAVEALIRLDDRGASPPRDVAAALLAGPPATRLGVATCLKYATTPVEDLLVPLLEDVDEIARAAADALGVHGTPDALPALRARADQVFAGPVGQACEAAITRIQSRVGGLRGGLAVLRGGEAGGLGLAGEGE